MTRKNLRKQFCGMQPGKDGKIPVFVFPNALTFYLDDQASHKQVLTLYNPYDFPVRFRVLSTSPKKYTVVDPEGSIKSKCCVDIVIRHSAVSAANCHGADKFRIQMYDQLTKQLLGRRDVVASLLSGEPDGSTPDKEFESLTLPPSSRPGHAPPSQYSLAHTRQETGSCSPHLYLLSTVAVVCIAVLFLPTDTPPATADDKDKDSLLPISWRVSINLKLVVSFVLGMVTMVILKPN